jgi:hypothetical protein
MFTMAMTPKELASALRALNSSEGSGLLEIIVFAGKTKNPDLIVDMEKLVATYRQFNCPNVAALAQYLASEVPELQELVNSKINTKDAPQAQFGMRIGNVGKGITPLEWLAYLADYLPFLQAIQITVFDRLCRSFHTKLLERKGS